MGNKEPMKPTHQTGVATCLTVCNQWGGGRQVGQPRDGPDGATSSTKCTRLGAGKVSGRLDHDVIIVLPRG